MCVRGRGEAVDDGGEKLFMDSLGNFFSMTNDDDGADKYNGDGKRNSVSYYFPFLLA